MIKDSEKRLFDIVLVWKPDRFSRDRYDNVHYKAILKKNGGSIPLGYVLNKEPKKLEINEITAPIVLEIFKRYAEGETIAAIKDDFNRRGLKTNNGCAFRINTILKNRKYIGEYKCHDIVIPDGVPAIMPIDLFEHVQTHMEKNKRTPAASKAEEFFTHDQAVLR